MFAQPGPWANIKIFIPHHDTPSGPHHNKNEKVTFCQFQFLLPHVDVSRCRHVSVIISPIRNNFYFRSLDCWIPFSVPNFHPRRGRHIHSSTRMQNNHSVMSFVTRLLKRLNNEPSSAHAPLHFNPLPPVFLIEWWSVTKRPLIIR